MFFSFFKWSCGLIGIIETVKLVYKLGIVGFKKEVLRAKLSISMIANQVNDY